jgi:hypothetical protein
MCGTKACWKALGTKGFSYSDSERTPDGVLRTVFSTGAVAGMMKAMVKGKGENLPAVTLPLGMPVVAELRGANDRCWKTTHSQAAVQRNDAAQFKARND